MQGQLLPFVYDLHFDRHVLRISPCVHGILVDLRSVTACPKEVQRHMEFSRGPVGDTAEIPLVPMPACDRHELAGLAIENARGVPLGWNILDELERRLVSISLRAVRNHLNWRLEDDV